MAYSIQEIDLQPVLHLQPHLYPPTEQTEQASREWLEWHKGWYRDLFAKSTWLAEQYKNAGLAFHGYPIWISRHLYMTAQGREHMRSEFEIVTNRPLPWTLQAIGQLEYEMKHIEEKLQAEHVSQGELFAHITTAYGLYQEVYERMVTLQHGMNALWSVDSIARLTNTLGSESQASVGRRWRWRVAFLNKLPSLCFAGDMAGTQGG